MIYFSNRGLPAGNPIANALVVIVGALAIFASLILGFFAFVVLASLVLVCAAIIGIRAWWFGRKLKRERRTRTAPGSDPAGSEVIEGEYRVIESRHGRRRAD